MSGSRFGEASDPYGLGHGPSDGSVVAARIGERLLPISNPGPVITLRMYGLQRPAEAEYGDRPLRTLRPAAMVPEPHSTTGLP